MTGRNARGPHLRLAPALAVVLAVSAAILAAGWAVKRASGPGGRAPGGGAAVDLRPANGEEVMRLVRETGARAVLLNVWATWCVPCREEFPDLVRLAREHRADGLRVVLVSGDFADEEPRVRRFLADQGVDFRTYLKTGKDMEFVDALDPDWSGALPTTWIFDAAGARRACWTGRASYDSLDQTVREILASPEGGES